MALNFRDTEIEHFDDEIATTNSILQMDNLESEERIAISILHKVYAKRGSGRKDSALRRGLPQSDAGAVDGITTRLVAAGLLAVVNYSSTRVFVPTRQFRTRVLELLEHPTRTALNDLVDIRAT